MLRRSMFSARYSESAESLDAGNGLPDYHLPPPPPKMHLDYTCGDENHQNERSRSIAHNAKARRRKILRFRPPLVLRYTLYREPCMLLSFLACPLRSHLPAYMARLQSLSSGRHISIDSLVDIDRAVGRHIHIVVGRHLCAESLGSADR